LAQDACPKLSKSLTVEYMISAFPSHFLELSTLHHWSNADGVGSMPMELDQRQWHRIQWPWYAVVAIQISHCVSEEPCVAPNIVAIFFGGGKCLGCWDMNQISISPKDNRIFDSNPALVQGNALSSYSHIFIVSISLIHILTVCYLRIHINGIRLPRSLRKYETTSQLTYGVSLPTEPKWAVFHRGPLHNKNTKGSAEGVGGVRPPLLKTQYVLRGCRSKDDP